MRTISFTPPSTEDFIKLRASVGWPNPESHLVSLSIHNSLFWVCIYESDKLVACGRVIGDNAMYFYIQDVIVTPLCQGQGLANTIMENIEAFINQHCQAHSTVGLLSVKGKERFYAKFDYLVRDGKTLGHGMCKFMQ